MSKLSYRTIAGENPQGKPKVYFSCHQDDFGTYFEEYALKILRIQDCAIWYEAEPEADYDREDLELNLAQMQLFIMPVTTKLLTTPNRAMDIEFQIAQERHIPVLPLMMEGSLDDVFSKRFGDLQYLDPNDKDVTRRSFDEVLETYIKSVLVSSDLAKRVRAAFDAYIFLSYRKKDRKKAQELMRLIHRNPLCRDIAIWYDEFLTPGEDFNQAIGEMLTKSDLFTLVVTPNLVNEINYVMTTEYPAALKQEKPVLPVEMVKTDRAQLEEHYEALPPCILGEDDEMLQKSLLEKIREMAVSANDEDPEHNFLIGLAYLDGIDVEVDSERAMVLIKGAAEAGVPEAISHLIMMYETGKGIKRDYLEGIRWREKKVEHLRKKFESDSTENAARKLIVELGYLGEAQRGSLMLDAAEASYHEMCIIAEKYAASDNKGFRSAVPVGYNMLGKLLEARGDLAGAQAYYEKALAITEELLGNAITVELGQVLFVIYSNLGTVADAHGDIDGAHEYYEKALIVSEAIYKDTGTVESRRDLSASYLNLGDNALKYGDVSRAEAYYEKGLAITEELARDTDTVESYRDLSNFYYKLGGVQDVHEDLTGVQDYYEKALAIREMLFKDTGTMESRRDLSRIYDRLGDVLKTAGDHVGAQDYYEKALAIREITLKDTGTMESFRDMSESYESLGDISRTTGDLAAAQAYYEKALAIREKIFKDTGTMESSLDMSRSYESLGDILKMSGDFIGAQDYYKKSLTISEEIYKATGTLQSCGRMSASYRKLGGVAEAQGDLDRAQAYYEKDLAIIEKMAKGTEYLDSQWDLFERYIRLSIIAEKRGDLLGAEAYIKKGLPISEAETRKTGTVESRQYLFSIYSKLGDFAKARGDLVGAKAYYESSLNIIKKLVKETGTVESRRYLSTNFYNLGNNAETREDLAGAQAYYEKSLTIIGKLVKETRLLQDFRDYSYACYINGLFYYNSMHNHNKAKELFERVLEISIEGDEYLTLLSEEVKQILDKYF